MVLSNDYLFLVIKKDLSARITRFLLVWITYMKAVVITLMAHGAAGQYIVQLANALSQICETNVIVPDYTDVRYLDKNVKLVRLPVPLGLAASSLKILNPFFFRSLLRKISETNADVIHIVVEYRFLFPYALWLKRKYPIAVTIHDPVALSSRRSRIANVLVGLIQYVNNRLLTMISNKVIIHGENVRGCRLISKLPDHKVEIISHGEFGFFARASEVIETVPGTVLFFGRIVPYKGIEYLIQAGKLVAQKVADVNITIAGEGDWANYEKLIGGDNHFTIHNRFIPDDEVARLFNKAFLIVLPYTSGSQSGVISIAAAFKKPVIVTDVGNLAEMVENEKTGLVIPPKDANALAEAMIRLLGDDKLRRQMGDNAYSLVKGKYSWDAVAKRTLEVYEGAIKSWHGK